MHSHRSLRAAVGGIVLASAIACQGTGESDTSHVAQTVARDSALIQQNVVLQAQKDSLILAARGLFDAMSAIDSATALAGVKAAKGSKIEGNAPYEAGVRQRTIKALERLRQVQHRLDASLAKVERLGGENKGLKDELETFRGTVTALQGQVAVQQQRVDSLMTQLAQAQVRQDSLMGKNRQLGVTVDSMVTESHRVYVVMGNKSYLIKNHLVDEVGGSRFPFIVKVGETLRPVNGQPQTNLYRSFDKTAERVIQLDANKRYEVVSAQDLAAVDLSNAKGRIFQGPIKINDPDKFWQPSSYLILREL